MSELLPRNNAERKAFFATRIALWTTNATAIGTTSTAVTALDGLVTAAGTALAAQETAQNAAKAATETVNNAMDAMTNAGMAIIEQVRTKARSAGDSVYPLANIPAPATPTPIGPPGTPTELKVELNPDGSIKMTWKCANPAGAPGPLYHVYRSITGAADDYEFVGGSGMREYTDSTVPAGQAIVYYKIQAIRTTAAGLTADFMVRFGNPGSSGITVTAMPPQSAPKIAA